jgi:hypothetical protein
LNRFLSKKPNRNRSVGTGFGFFKKKFCLVTFIFNNNRTELKMTTPKKLITFKIIDTDEKVFEIWIYGGVNSSIQSRHRFPSYLVIYVGLSATLAISILKIIKRKKLRNWRKTFNYHPLYI